MSDENEEDRLQTVIPKVTQAWVFITFLVLAATKLLHGLGVEAVPRYAFVFPIFGGLTHAIFSGWRLWRNGELPGLLMASGILGWLMVAHSLLGLLFNF